MPLATPTSTSRATTWRGTCSRRWAPRSAGRRAEPARRGSMPSTSTWPATRRVVSTPPASRSGWPKHYGTPAGKPVFDGYFPAAQAASATPLKAGRRVLPKFEYPVWPAVGVPVVNLEDQSGIIGFTAELPAEAQATLGQKEYVNVSSATTRARRLRQEGRPVPALRGRGHAPRAGWQRRLRRSRLDVPDHRGGPGHVRAPEPLGRDRPEAAARARCEVGRARRELQGVARRERQHDRRCPVALPRRRARPLRRAGARPDHLRARGSRGSARRRRARRRSTRASTPT